MHKDEKCEQSDSAGPVASPCDPALVQADRSDKDSPSVIFSNTLNDGFKLARLLFCLLAVAFLFSNIYWVDEGSVAVHTRFGRILGAPGGRFVAPGGPYLAMPYPIDKIIKIPTTMQTLAIDRAFSVLSFSSDSAGNYDRIYSAPTESSDGDYPENDQSNPYVSKNRYLNSLIPGMDGFLVTGDKNIVQGTWELNYRLDPGGKHSTGDKPTLFIENIGDMQKAEKFLRNIIEQEIAAHVASMTVDDFIRGAIDDEAIMKRAQTKLDGLSCGISITSLSSRKYGVPPSLVEVFQSVNKAQSEKANKIESAKRYRSEALNETAGADFQNLVDLIDAYELAAAGNDEAGKRNASDKFGELSESPLTSGKVAAYLESARTYKTKTVEFVRAASSRFSLLLEQHRENPDFMENRLFEDCVQVIFSGNARKFHLPKDRKKTIYLELDTKE